MAKSNSELNSAHLANKVKTIKNKKIKMARLEPILLGSLLPISLLIIWEWVSNQGIIPTYQLPAPSIIYQTLMNMAQTGELMQHVSITVYRVFAGFLLGTLVAVGLGSLVGFYPKIEQIFDPVIQALRSIPSLAWVPLFILWMGIGESSKITMIAVGVFFPVYLNLVSGIKNVDRKLIEVGKMYKLSAFEQVKRIILPASIPSFFVGLRSGLGLGWMFVVASELMGASQGLGYLLVLGQNTLSPETILTSIILFAFIGKLTDWLLKMLEQRFLRWQSR